MNYDQLARDYEPRDPYSNPEQRQKGVELGQYAHAMAQRQEYSKGAILGAEVKQRQQGGVTREVQQFEKNLNALICVIDSLDNRLSTATIPAPETASGLRGTDSGGSVLANQLSVFNGMLSQQINRLESIYQGIDL